MKKPHNEIRAFLELDQNRSIRNAFLLDEFDNLSSDARSVLASGKFSVYSLNLTTAPEPGQLKDYLAEKIDLLENSHDWVLVNMRVGQREEELEVSKVLTQLGERFRNLSEEQNQDWLKKLDGLLEKEIQSIVDRLDQNLTGDQVQAELRYGFGWALGRWMAEWYLGKFENAEEAQPARLEDDRGHANALYLDLGANLAGLLHPPQDPPVLKELAAIREQLRDQLGFGLPDVTVQLDADLAERDFRLRFRERTLTTGRVQADYLVLTEGDDTYRWIQRIEEQPEGQVLTAPEVLRMHLTVTLQEQAWRLLTVSTVNSLLDALEREDPTVVYELERENVPLSAIRAVLRELLRERCSIADLSGIFEAILEAFPGSRSLPDLTAKARRIFGAGLYHHLLDGQNRLEVVELSLETEADLLSQNLSRGLTGGTGAIREGLARYEAEVLLVNPVLRPLLWNDLHLDYPHLTVLAYDEIEGGQPLLRLGEI